MERRAAVACLHLDYCSAPAINAEPTGPTSAEVSVTPPPGGPWSSYDVTLCPIGGPASECVTTKCTTPASCPVTGLNPDTSYVTTASTVCLAQRCRCSLVLLPFADVQLLGREAVVVDAAAWPCLPGH